MFGHINGGVRHWVPIDRCRTVAQQPLRQRGEDPEGYGEDPDPLGGTISPRGGKEGSNEPVIMPPISHSMRFGEFFYII